MAGLLDDLLGNLNSDQGLLGLAMLSAAAPRERRTTLGEGLMSGLNLVNQRKLQREEQAMRQAEMRMREQDFGLRQKQAGLQEQQILQALEAQKRAQEQAQQRQRYLGSVDPMQGPAMPVSMAGGMAAGLAPQEAAALMPPPPKDEKPLVLKPGEVAFGSGGKQLFSVPEKADKAPEALRTLALIYGEGSPEYMNAARALAQKMTTHQPATKVEVNTGDRIPPALVKQQDDLIDKMTIARATDTDLGALATQIKGGTLKFGPIRNLWNTGKNVAGASDEESRAFGTFKSTLEKMRNDSLRLNAGVQTEGDAQRAWNELFQNINDTAFVGQRLEEIRKINQRAAQMHEYRLNVLRQNSGAGPLPQPTIPPAIEPARGPQVPQVGEVRQGYRFKGGNPADPASWEKTQ